MVSDETCDRTARLLESDTSCVKRKDYVIGDEDIRQPSSKMILIVFAWSTSQLEAYVSIYSIIVIIMTIIIIIIINSNNNNNQFIERLPDIGFQLPFHFLSSYPYAAADRKPNSLASSAVKSPYCHILARFSLAIFSALI